MRGGYFMDGHGLYLPKIFKDQKYSDEYNIPFKELKDKKTFVPQSYFENLLTEDKMLFNKITTEMSLRGGKFIVDTDPFNYPENNITDNKVIYVSLKTPNSAFERIDFDTIDIGYIKETLDINGNNFFHNIPLDGFKSLFLTDTELIILEEEFLNAGFKIYKARDSMLSVHKDKMTVLVNNNTSIENSNPNKKDEKFKSQHKETQNHQLLDTPSVKKADKDLQISTEKLTNNTLYYALNQSNKVEKMPQWVNFFIEVGRYIAESNELTLYLNFLDDVIPASFISLGILDSIYGKYENDFILEKWISKNIKKSQVVSYLFNENANGSQEWRKAKVLEIKNIQGVDDKFNPYLIVEIELPKQRPITQQVPKTKILEKVRVGGRVKRTAGSTVYINDRLSKRFKNLFSESTIDILKFTNQDYINLIGYGKTAKFKEFSESITLYGPQKEDNASFKLSDWFYFEDSTNNLANINIINSESSNFDNKNTNLFVGANAGLRYYNFKNKKIFF